MLSIALAALLYWRGVRYSVRHGMARRLTWGREAGFAAGLLAVVVALESPIDLWSDRYLWVHMIQHELLTMVAAPLLVLGSPALPLLRAIPLRARRPVLRWGVQQAWLTYLWRKAGRRLGSPAGTWMLFVGDFVLWHLPPLYDLTLEHSSVHHVEHLLFLGTAVLFWGQVIPSPPFAARRSLTDRAVFLGLFALFGNLFDVIFISSPVPIYSPYAAIPRHPGMMPPLIDQSVAAGVMGSVNAVLLAGALLFWRRSFNREQTSGMLESHAPSSRTNL